jgi:hypothetical protein
MAGLGGLPFFLQDQQAAQQQVNQNQEAQMKLVAFRQQQQDLQRQQAAQTAYGQYLASLGQQGAQSQPQGQMPPPPTAMQPQQTPAPGQASQPMQQPGQAQGQPPQGQGLIQQGQGPTQGQSAGMGVGNQLPPPPIQQAYQAGMQAGAKHVMTQLQQRQGQMQQPQPQGQGQQLPPFQAMPASPPQQQQAASSAIPAPPQGQQQPAPQGQPGGNGPISLQGALQWMDRNGIAPADRPAVLAQMAPLLDYQSKQQLAMAQEQDRQARERETEAYHHASLDTRADTSAASGWTLVTDSSGKNYRLNTRTGEAAPVELGGAPASGVTKTGAKFTPGVGASDVTDYGQPLKNTTWESNAQAIAEGRAAPIPLSSRAKGAQETMARVMQINPDYDAKDYGTKATAEKYWATGKGGQQVNSVNTAFSHLGNLQEAGKALQNGGAPAWNAFANRVATEAGMPAPTNFEAQKEVVSDEVVKAMVGAGGGTLEDRSAVKSIFSNAKTPDQMQGAMESVRKLMAGKLEAMDRQYTKSTGRDDFRDYLSPEAASYLPEGKSASGSGLPVGYVYQGYRFKGGDSGVKSNWEKM